MRRENKLGIKILTSVCNILDRNEFSVTRRFKTRSIFKCRWQMRDMDLYFVGSFENCSVA